MLPILGQLLVGKGTETEVYKWRNQRACLSQAKAPAHMETWVKLNSISNHLLAHAKAEAVGASLVGLGHSTHTQMVKKQVSHIRLSYSTHQNMRELYLGTDSVGELWAHL